MRAGESFADGASVARDASERTNSYGRILLAALVRPFIRPARHANVPLDPSGRNAIVFAGLFLTFEAVAWLAVYVDPAAAAWQRALPRWFTHAFHPITALGNSGWILWPTGVAFLLLCGVVSTSITPAVRAIAATWMARVGVVFLCVGIPGLSATLIKRLIGRARPDLFDALGQLAFSPLAMSSKFASFPSGHATTAFAAAMVFGMQWPRARIILFASAILIAASRVIVGAHFPSDIIAGAIFGAAFSWLIVRAMAERRIAFTLTPEGRVRPMPGAGVGRLFRLAMPAPRIRRPQGVEPRPQEHGPQSQSLAA